MNTRQTDVIDGETGEVQSGSGFPSLGALGTLTKAEIDQQITTAKQYPRNVTTFTRKATELVTKNKPLADSCNYALPRKGKGGKQVFINGASIRLAEIVAQAFGNCRSAARVIGEDGDYIIAQGVFHDLESNAWTSTEVRRRIVDSYGRRYSVDMIGVTANAACSIAKRNAILQGIGKGLWDPIYTAALQTSKGDIKTLDAARAELVKHFGGLGVTEKEIAEAVDVAGIADIGLDQLVTLRALARQIKDGGISVDGAFRPVPEPTKSASKEAADRALDGTPTPAAAEPEKKPAEPLDLAGGSAVNASLAIEAIKACKTKAELDTAWKRIRKSYKDAGVDMPIEVDAARADKLEALEQQNARAALEQK